MPEPGLRAVVVAVDGWGGGGVMTDDVLGEAVAWLKAGRRVVVATVIRTDGSAPRPVGCQMMVDDTGAMVGSVSAGCLEGAVVEQALRAMEDGEPRLVRFGAGAGLICGGRIEVYVEPLEEALFKRDRLDRLMRARALRQPVALVTDLVTAQKSLVFEAGVHGDFGFDEPTLASIRRSLALNGSTILTPTDDSRIFVHVFTPPPRLVVIGAEAIAAVLLPMARLAGFDVTIIDPRRAFADAERFAEAATSGVLVSSWPDEALAAMVPDSRTAVVALSHDPKIDDPALVAALAAPTGYVGALGSRKTHALRLQRLAAMGVGEAELARIHGPVGLGIGAIGAGEIAVSILAGVIQTLRRDHRLRPS